jgi:ribosome-associated heat shock protein Hsp15
MRIDKFLFFVRLIKSRTLAQKLVEEGHIRIDGKPIGRAHAEVRPGMVLTVPIGGGVRVIRVVALPARRGPAPEAQACYADLAAG